MQTKPTSFTDDELSVLMQSAEAIPVEYRSAFLSAAATALATDPADRPAVIALVQRRFLGRPPVECCSGSCNDRWSGD
jgi:hypothetical protein